MKSYLWVLLSVICFVKFCSCCNLAPTNQEKLAVKVLWSYNSKLENSLSERTVKLIRSVCDNYAKFGTTMTLELHLFSYVQEINGVIECEQGKDCYSELWEACSELTGNALESACCTDSSSPCEEKLQKKEKEVNDCIKKGLSGPGGQRLLASRQVIDKAGVKEPPEAAVTFNDKFVECVTEQATQDFVGTACALYKPEAAPAEVCGA